MTGHPLMPDNQEYRDTAHEANTARGERTSETPAGNPDDDFLTLAKKRFRLASEAENRVREAALADLKFYLGEQWPADIMNDRLTNGRPCLTINRLPPIAKQVINMQRQAKPSIVINPVGDGADVEDAEILQGLCRHIEVASNADVAYDTAFEHMVIGGFGYFRILTDYVATGSNFDLNDPSVFDQEIRIGWVPDQFTVYMDPNCREPDRSDAQWAFVVADYTPEAYREEFGEEAMTSLGDFRSVGDGERDWFHGGHIRIAEYYWITKEKRRVVRLTDGRNVFEDEMADDDAIELRDGEPVSRIVQVPTVHWCKLNARQKLKERVVPGDYIPIIPVLGDQFIVDGELRLIGMVRNAKDGQRFYNYAQTGIVEQISLASKNQWKADEEAIEGYEQDYAESNRKNVAVLKYRSRGVGGREIAAPLREAFEPPIQALTQLLAQSDNNIKASIGIYDASLGQRGPDESGKAILARKTEGDEATFHLTDNLTRAIKYAAKVILSMRPAIYDNARMQRIVNPDGSHRVVPINQHYVQMGEGKYQTLSDPGQDVGGRQVKYHDMTSGRYDVTIAVGPSYQSRRQEFVASVMTLVQAAPQLLGFVGDLLVRSMDWPGANEIADRLKKMLPPQLQQDDQQPEEISPAAQAKLAQLLQQNAGLIAQLNAATSIIETKRLDLESKERIAALNNQVQIIVAELKAKSSDAQKLAGLEFASVEHRLDLLHEGIALEQDIQSQAQQAQAQPPGAQPAPATPAA